MNTDHKTPRRRLLIVKQWFDPEPTTKGLAFAQAMTNHGFDVEVVTGFPNYPGGKVYPGYRIRPIQRETHGEVRVTRLALYPSHDSGKIGRILNYASFALSVFVYLTFFARRADVIYAYHPPITSGMAVACAGWLRRTRFLLDVQDLWPDTLRATGMIGNDRVLRLIGRLCAWTYRRAAHISVLSNGFRDVLMRRGVPADRISVIPNWADDTIPSGDEAGDRVPFGPPGPFRVLFAGNMGRAQGLDTVLDAARLLAGDPQIEICLLGSGVEGPRLEARCKAEHIDNIRFLPRVSFARAKAYLQAADALLVHLRDDPLFAITIPSKTQAYLAAGRPIIMAVRGDAAEMIRAAAAGSTPPPGDAAALAAAIRDLAAMSPDQRDELGAKARAYYEQHLAMEVGIRKLADLLRGLIPGG